MRCEISIRLQYWMAIEGCIAETSWFVSLEVSLGGGHCDCDVGAAKVARRSTCGGFNRRTVWNLPSRRCVCVDLVFRSSGLCSARAMTAAINAQMSAQAL